ncbi:unnamed protein product [Calypogeia fissa]
MGENLLKSKRKDSHSNIHSLIINLKSSKNKYREQIQQLDRHCQWMLVRLELQKRFLGINVNAREATIFDGGVVKCNSITLPKVGKSLTALLSLPDSKLSQFKDEFVRESDWVIESESAAEAAEAAKDAVRKGNGMKGINLLIATPFREGYGGNYWAKATNDTLGVEQEDFDEVIKELLQEVGAGK